LGSKAHQGVEGRKKGKITRKRGEEKVEEKKKNTVKVQPNIPYKNKPS